MVPQFILNPQRKQKQESARDKWSMRQPLLCNNFILDKQFSVQHFHLFVHVISFTIVNEQSNTKQCNLPYQKQTKDNIQTLLSFSSKRGHVKKNMF